MIYVYDKRPYFYDALHRMSSQGRKQQTWNRYAYVGNNPLNTIDLLGLCDSREQVCPPSFVDPSTWEFVCRSGTVLYDGADATGWFCGFRGPGWQLGFGRGGGGKIPPVPKPPAMNPPKPPSNLAPRLCSGSARVLQGNPDTIGKTGGFGNPVLANSAAVIPAQWGGAKNLRGSLLLIGGTAGTGNAAQTFHGISDTIGSQDVPNVQTYLQNKYPNAVILELVSGQDSTAFNPQDVIVQINLHVPPEISCPSFTTETGRVW